MRALAVLLLVLSCVLLPSLAAADERAAKEAYDRASEAFSRKSYSEAAAGFALADRLEPNPIALEAAFKAVLLADDPVLGMDLVERAEQRPRTPKIDSYMLQAKAAFASRAGKLAVTCADERGCTVKLNGVSLELGKQHWVRAGKQALEVTVDGVVSAHSVEIKAGGVVDFTAPAPPRKEPPQLTPEPPQPKPQPQQIPPPALPPPREEPSRGIHPAIFGITIGLFGLAGALTIWSGLDALSLNDSYQDGDDSALEPGMAAQDRTNAFIGVTLGGAIATTIVGIFTDWGSKPAAKASVSLRARGVTVSF